MKKFLKLAGYVLGGLVALIVIGAIAVFIASNARLNATWSVASSDVALPTDSASLDRGHHLTVIMGCTECHGADFGGKSFIDVPPLLVLSAPNLTAGKGGAQNRYDAAGIVRAIRQGIGNDDRSLLIMPAPDYNQLSDADVGAIIAWIRQAPPVDNEVPAPAFGPVGRFLLATNQLPGLIVAAAIDHSAARPPAPAPGPTVEYGKYLAHLCAGCHQNNFAGTTKPGPDGSPPARNITPAGPIGNWSLEQFISTIRIGTTPAGYQLRGEFMPWPTIAKMTDEELEAIYLFLKSVPPAVAGEAP